MSGLTFNDLLRLAGIDPRHVNVMLHSPRHGDMLTLMPSLVRTRRKAVEAYQATHSKPAERTLSQGRPFVASFAKASAERRGDQSRMIFIGMYRNRGGRLRSLAEIWAEPDVRWLNERFGAGARFADADPGRHWVWFDLVAAEELSELIGRLVVLARLTRSYVRLAENLDAPVAAIHEIGLFDSPP